VFFRLIIVCAALDLWLWSTGTDPPLEIVLCEVYAASNGLVEKVSRIPQC